MNSVKRICLWSGPRNISTALMYAFAQRPDTKVFDELLYTYYLKQHPEAHLYHPGTTAILESMENDGEKVVTMMLTNKEKPVLFFKHMTHHLFGLDRRFMKQMVNIILTRNPEEMLPSFDKVIHNPKIDDVGYKQHVDLMNYFKEHQIPFTVLDSKKLLLNPEATLQRLCEFIEISYNVKMLSWVPQQRKEDGVWAKYWYGNVHKSSGFYKYEVKTANFPPHLKDLLSECLPYYNELVAHAI